MTERTFTDPAELDCLPLLIDVSTAAQIRGSSEKFIRDLAVRGEISASKLGGQWRINRDSFLEACGLK